MKKLKKLVAVIIVLTVVMTVSVAAFCEQPEDPPTLDIDFDVASMFSWSQIIINALMPVVYVVMGLGLGFLIINNLKRAFMGSVH